MKFTSDTIKKAWEIRRAVAAELNCKVTDVVWSICLEMAGEKEAVKIEILGNVWVKHDMKRLYLSVEKVEGVLNIYEDDKGYYCNGEEISHMVYCYILQFANGGFYDYNKKAWDHKKNLNGYRSYFLKAIGAEA